MAKVYKIVKFALMKKVITAASVSFLLIFLAVPGYFIFVANTSDGGPETPVAIGFLVFCLVFICSEAFTLRAVFRGFDRRAIVLNKTQLSAYNCENLYVEYEWAEITGIELSGKDEEQKLVVERGSDPKIEIMTGEIAEQLSELSNDLNRHRERFGKFRNDK